MPVNDWGRAAAHDKQAREMRAFVNCILDGGWMMLVGLVCMLRCEAETRVGGRFSSYISRD